ncbi:hypothetical protein [uncultured Thomasclavelia sp.]|uniref:hypothetical protein n=1 Tax=uncultured Thomasclavelia sp. TaxID=3025759 RepID=UPI0025FDBC04|nr:hypothetical protein [uncultured Thomasclavelia sp.]
MKWFQLTHKGSILQVVLIVLLITILNIGVFFTNVMENSRGIVRIKELDENRLVELSIIYYFKETIADSILFSDEVTIEDYRIYYTVDDMGDYYYIVTDVTKKTNKFSFEIEIELDSLIIRHFEYQ